MDSQCPGCLGQAVVTLRLPSCAIVESPRRHKHAPFVNIAFLCSRSIKRRQWKHKLDYYGVVFAHLDTGCGIKAKDPSGPPHVAPPLSGIHRSESSPEGSVAIEHLCTSVHWSHIFHKIPFMVSSWNFPALLQLTKWCPCQCQMSKVKVTKVKINFDPRWEFPDGNSNMNLHHDDIIKRNVYRVTGPLCGDVIGHRWIPLITANDAGLWYFLWSATE